MLKFIKYVGLFFGIQAFFCLVCLLLSVSAVGVDLMTPLVYIYWPAVLLLAQVLSTHGESAMMWPFFLGVPVGMVLYSLLLSCLYLFLRAFFKTRSC